MTSDDGVTVERVGDVGAVWPDVSRLFVGLVEYHAPLTGERLRDGWEQALRESLGRPESLVLLARDADGHAIGLAAAAEHRNPVLGTAVGYLDTVYVEAGWRRRGLGRRFVAAAEEWCRERGLRRLDLSVRAANVEGIAAWRALGFLDESLRLKKAIAERE